MRLAEVIRFEKNFSVFLLFLISSIMNGGITLNRRTPVVGLSLKNYINTLEKTESICNEINLLCGQDPEIEQFVFPSLGTISAARDAFFHKGNIQFGVQNISPKKNGAYTGEYSIESLIEIGGTFVEIAHNERLSYFNETAEQVNEKIALVLSQQLVPVVCIGEGNQKVEKELFLKAIEKQLSTYFKDIAKEQVSKVIFAYEPGWAIGKTQAADPKFIHEAHYLIRELLKKKFGKEIAEQIRIIYGGSVSKENAEKIVLGQDVDGLFIGRFGHLPKNYAEIVSIVKKVKGSELK